MNTNAPNPHRNSFYLPLPTAKPLSRTLKHLALQALLLDLDGTLLDTANDITDAVNHVLTHHGYRAQSYEFVRALISGGAKKIINTCFAIDENHEKYKVLHYQLLEAYQQQLNKHTDFFPGMWELLELLRRQAIPWGVVTNKPFWLAQALLKRFDANDCGCLLGHESLPACKPSPLPLLYASHCLRVAPQQCVYVGDAPTDVIAANCANMISIGATYGYLAPDENPKQWAADHLVGSPAELTDLLLDD